MSKSSLKSKLAYMRQFAENVHAAGYRLLGEPSIPLTGVFTVHIAMADNTKLSRFLCTFEVDELEDIIVDWDPAYTHLIPTPTHTLKETP